MIILRPTKALVDKFVGIPPAGLPPRAGHPGDLARGRASEEWPKNHRQYALQQLLPEIRPPEHVWRVCAEAYLTDVQFQDTQSITLGFYPTRLYSFEESLCDGSTAVPDLAYRWGRIKDPWSVGHDLLCVLNKYDLPDVYGRRWSRTAADRMYRGGWYAQHNYVIGSMWWVGLFLGSWIPWNTAAHCRPECKTFQNDCLPLCKSCRHDYMVGAFKADKLCSECQIQWDAGTMGPRVGSNWRAVLRDMPKK